MQVYKIEKPGISAKDKDKIKIPSAGYIGGYLMCGAVTHEIDCI